MRHLPAAVGLTLLTTALAGCQNAPGGSPLAESTAAALPTAPIHEAEGLTSEALGVYWLVRDPANPLSARLERSRTVAAQGDLYALSVRPFMDAPHLQVLGSAAGPNDTTDYTLRFTHPFAMPADLVRPATAQKRADLFLFDVQTVLVTPGGNHFFGGEVQTNVSAMPSASGYRQLGPMVDLPGLGIVDGTNVFPYQLFSNADHATNPVGNFDTAGWTGDEFLTPTGYDVIPQGGQATAIARVSNNLPATVAVVVVAKYMDPRGGATAIAKRANRLPDPADPTALRYFLPEAAGDLQSTSVTVNGSLVEQSSAESVQVSATVLDWDNAATVATVFPNSSDLTQISEASRPTQVEASFPQLKAVGTFPGYVGDSSGLANEFVAITLPVNNADGTYAVTGATGDELNGLIRIRETQDLTGPLPYVLDESQAPQALPPGFELSTRYQLAGIHINPAAPVVTSVAPLNGARNESVTFNASVAGGAVTSWAWDFGVGASPSASSVASPTVVLAGVDGSYPGSVTVSNASGDMTFDFTLVVALTAPTLPPTPFNYANVVLPPYYVDPAAPQSAANSNNMPPNNQISNAGATLGRVLFHDVRLSQNNTISCASCHQQAHGFSDPAQFSTGFDGGLTGRHSMSLTNARFYANGRFFWDERAATLEAQVLGPIQNEVEMGMALPDLEVKLTNTSFYGPLFTAAFGDPTITSNRISLALAQFVRSLVSFQSKEDQALQAGPNGRQLVFTPQELEGFRIFTANVPGEPSMNCAQCHRTAANTLGAGGQPPPGPGPGPFATNNGLDLETSADEGAGQGRFKSPSLRNIEVTGPYMHDGRFATLLEVVEFYANGVQPHPNLSPSLREGDQPGNPPERFALTQQHKDALVAYLRTLTDNTFLTDEKFSNPFPE